MFTKFRFVNCDELELFLYGLDIGHLIPLFKEHQLTFPQVLRLTEEELVQVGVKQMGTRKKLYCALQDVRTNEWDTQTLSTEKKAKLTTLEMAAVIANVTKHLECIQGCVMYVEKMIQKRKDELAVDNRNLQKSLIDQCDLASKMSTNLRNTLYTLNTHVVKAFPNVQLKPADSIQSKVSHEKSSTSKIIVKYAIATGIISLSIFVGYKILIVDKT